jgi:cardiolipin synthase
LSLSARIVFSQIAFAIIGSYLMAAVQASQGRSWLSSRVWNAANLLTLSRLILAPFAIREILLRHPRNAFFLVFLAGWTDLFDGLVARATHSNSEFGQLLDPLADKVLLSGVFLGLTWIGTVPMWFVAIVFGRDLFLLIASSVVILFTSYRDLKPNSYGKASTLFQIFAAGILILGNGINSSQALSVGSWLLWPAALLTAVSGVQYLARGLAHFSHRFRASS